MEGDRCHPTQRRHILHPRNPRREHQHATSTAIVSTDGRPTVSRLPGTRIDGFRPSGAAFRWSNSTSTNGSPSAPQGHSPPGSGTEIPCIRSHLRGTFAELRSRVMGRQQCTIMTNADPASTVGGTPRFLLHRKAPSAGGILTRVRVMTASIRFTASTQRRRKTTGRRSSTSTSANSRAPGSPVDRLHSSGMDCEPSGVRTIHRQPCSVASGAAMSI